MTVTKIDEGLYRVALKARPDRALMLTAAPSEETLEGLKRAMEQLVREDRVWRVHAD